MRTYGKSIFEGSAAAPAAVRCALAPNMNVVTPIKQNSSPSHNADDEGVAGCARGGRAPYFQFHE